MYDIKPMLLKTTSKPFDNKDYIFELKFDGIRCIAYCNKNQTKLFTRNNNEITLTFPELLQIHKQCKKSCVLDGEIVYVDQNGKLDFSALQKRLMTKTSSKIDKISKEYPASFVVFDILVLENKNLMNKPLMERKDNLNKNVKENDYITISKHIDTYGTKMFEFVKENNLEGIIAKNKNSLYFPGKRSDNWLKIKNILDEDFNICGYIRNEKGEIKDAVICKLENGKPVLEGKIYVGANKYNREFLEKFAKINTLKKPLFKNQDPNIVWLKPTLVCTVEFLEKTKTNQRRQPIFKGFKFDL